MGVVLVCLILWRYDLRGVFDVIVKMDLLRLGEAWVFAFLAMIAFVYMQAIIFRPLGDCISPLFLLKVQFQQRFYAMFLPGGGALVVKWYKLAKPSGRPGIAAALMLLMPLVAGSTGMSVVALAVFADESFPWPGVRWAMPAAVVVLWLGSAALFSKRIRRGLARLRPPIRLPKRLKGFGAKLASIPAAMDEFSKRDVALMLLFGSLSQALFILQLAYCGYAVGIDLPAVTIGWLVALLGACSAVPITVSGLGLREACSIVLLSEYGISEERAIGFSLAFFAAFPVVKGVIGGVTELVDLLRAIHRDRLARNAGEADRGAQSG